MIEASPESFNAVINKCKNSQKLRIAIVGAHDANVLQAVKMAEDMGFAEALLIGDASKIVPIVKESGIKRAETIHAADDHTAAGTAVSLINDKKADILMKGLINSSDFLRAVLDAGKKQPDTFLSHLGVFQIPGQKKLLYMTDGGMNINPDLEQKKKILVNSIDALRSMGIDQPKTAIVSANEKVHSKMQSTVDAQALVDMRKKGEIPYGIIEGPMALDVAVSQDAAAHKGIQSAISGDVDLYLVPNIEAGNIWGKSLIYNAGAKMAGLVIGAEYPIVMTSRAETPEGKLYSIAMACLMAGSKPGADNHERNGIC